MKTEIYKQAEYYEIAFDFVDIPKQINIFEELISKYSVIPVKTVLDIACGPSLQLREFARRGYRCIGLDLNKEMLEYLEQKSIEYKLNVETFKANMSDFALIERADFAYILMGSIAYLKNNLEFVSHLQSVAKSLNSGGLYVIENLAMTWADPEIWKPQEWEMERDKIKVEASYKISLKDELTQTIEQIIKLRVNDNGKTITLEDKDELKLIMPQEFKSIVDLQGDFEFVGFFERWKSKELVEANPDNIIVLRRKSG